MSEFKAIAILIVLLTAAGITGTTAVIIVVIFAIIERLIYVVKFKNKDNR